MYPLILLLLFSTFVAGQIRYSEKDSILVVKQIENLSSISKIAVAESLIEIGKSFLGKPYVEKTLEIGVEEQLVINLSGFDCTTYIENVLAFDAVLQEPNPNFYQFTKALKTLRYRNGSLEGYPSRLHYFTDWIRDNSKKGIVKNITSELGGVEIEKPIDFMGTHRALYPLLSQEANYQQILVLEEELKQYTLCVLPQSEIATNESKIQSGDIIALATSIKGLDVTHTGFALRQPNGRIHLLHASTSGSVTITKEPLVDYLKKIKNNTGIIVARPL